MTLEKIAKGGKRPGAGRPKVEGRFMQLRLSDQEIERAKLLGDGNVSLGVRRALAAQHESPAVSA